MGSPVQSPAPVACTLFVRGEAAMLTAKGESRGGLEPGVPAWRVHHHLSRVPVPLVGEDSIVDDRRYLSHRSLPLLPCSTEQGFPNSIAYVRELVPAVLFTASSGKSLFNKNVLSCF